MWLNPSFDNYSILHDPASSSSCTSTCTSTSTCTFLQIHQHSFCHSPPALFAGGLGKGVKRNGQRGDVRAEVIVGHHPAKVNAFIFADFGLQVNSTGIQGMRPLQAFASSAQNDLPLTHKSNVPILSITKTECLTEERTVAGVRSH